MAKDNLNFFCADHQQLLNVKEQLESLVQYLREPDIPGSEIYPSAGLDVVKDYNSAIKLYRRLVGRNLDYIAALEDREKIERLEKESTLTRLFFYLILRTVGRSHIAIQRGSQEWRFAYAAQAIHLARQVGLLENARSREQLAVRKIGRFSIHNSLYSLACSVSREILLAFAKNLRAVKTVALAFAG